MHLGPVVKPSQLSIQRIKDRKRRRFLLACVLLSALALLTIGLKDVDLQASAPVIFEQQEGDPGFRPTFLGVDRAFIVVAFLQLLIVLLLFLPHALRRRAMAVLFSLAIVAFLFYLSSSSVTDGLPQRRVTPAAQTDDLTPPAADLTPQAAAPSSVQFRPPEFPTLLLYLISLAVTLSLILIIWVLYRWRRSQPALQTTQTLEEIGEAARLALNDLAAGLDEKDAVIQCYARMSDLVLHSQNIERGASRTATEFADWLESAGLPGESVRRLTRLFESVRYGAHASQPFEIEEARACLTDIARYCGENI